MQKNILITAGFVVLCVLVVGFILFVEKNSDSRVQSGVPGRTLIATSSYTCDEGKNMTVSYYESSNKQGNTSKEGEMPLPTGSVKVELSDGRKLDLHQTVSGSGIRYADADETFVFWSKGSTAFLTEGKTQTYTNCVATDTPSGE